MLRRTTALSATLALAAAAVAPLPLAQATSNATFTKKANAICAAAGAKIEAMPKLTDANAVHELRASANVLSSMITKLDALTPPHAKKAKYQSFLSISRTQATLAKQAATAVEKHQTAKAQSLAEKVDKAGRKGDALAKALKLGDCAKSYNPGGAGGSAT